MQLIVVFTPWQFCNALEFIKGHPNKYRILVLDTNEKNISQIRNIDVEDICEFPFVKFQFFHQEILWLIKLIYFDFFFSIHRFERLVLGNINDSVGLLIANKFSRGNKLIYLLDDGLATIKQFKTRNCSKSPLNLKIYGGRYLKLYSKIFKIGNHNQIKKVVFFTRFNLQSVCNPSIDLVENFLVPFSLKSKSVNKNLVWFIGGPLVENKIMKEQLFKDILQYIQKHCEIEDKKLVYIPHRFEREAKARYEIIFNRPIEIEFSELAELPGLIISFYSTALVNLSQFEIPDIEFKYIDLTKFGVHSMALSDVYKYIKSIDSINEFVIPFDNLSTI